MQALLYPRLVGCLRRQMFGRKFLRAGEHAFPARQIICQLYGRSIFGETIFHAKSRHISFELAFSRPRDRWRMSVPRTQAVPKNELSAGQQARNKPFLQPSNFGLPKSGDIQIRKKLEAGAVCESVKCPRGDATNTTVTFCCSSFSLLPHSGTTFLRYN